MKYYIYLLLSVVIFASCGSSKKVESNYIVRDSVHIRDSTVLRDSVVIRYETNVIDSVNIRDSVVLTLDKDGKVLVTEKYHLMERNRNSTRNEVTSINQQKSHKLNADHHNKEDTNISKQSVKSPSNSGKMVLLLLLLGLLLGFCFFTRYYCFKR